MGEPIFGRGPCVQTSLPASFPNQSLGYIPHATWNSSLYQGTWLSKVPLLWGSALKLHKDLIETLKSHDHNHTGLSFPTVSISEGWAVFQLEQGIGVARCQRPKITVAK